MKAPMIVQSTIAINASSNKVWDALINPEQTKKYMFGCETVSDWKIGSSLLWKGMHEGKEMIFVKGEIVELKPEKFFAYTTIDPNSNIDDTSENYLKVTYDLKSENNQTILSVSQGDYSQVAEGERRYKETMDGGGWDPILKEIKKLVEAENIL
jgi:uncharacterized protein YndB with AHSA1/START domain